jgi:hypothetical protein
MGTLTPIFQQFIGYAGLTCVLGLIPIVIGTLWVWQLKLWAPEARESSDE